MCCSRHFIFSNNLNWGEHLFELSQNLCLKQYICAISVWPDGQTIKHRKRQKTNEKLFNGLNSGPRSPPKHFHQRQIRTWKIFFRRKFKNINCVKLFLPACSANLFEQQPLSLFFLFFLLTLPFRWSQVLSSFFLQERFWREFWISGKSAQVQTTLENKLTMWHYSIVV